jgi:hypothetical protein
MDCFGRVGGFVGNGYFELIVVMLTTEPAFTAFRGVYTWSGDYLMYPEDAITVATPKMAKVVSVFYVVTATSRAPCWDKQAVKEETFI